MFGGSLAVNEDVTRAASIEALHAIIRVVQGANLNGTINAAFNSLVSVTDIAIKT
jgi:hypothetical protein